MRSSPLSETARKLQKDIDSRLKVDGGNLTPEEATKLIAALRPHLLADSALQKALIERMRLSLLLKVGTYLVTFVFGAACGHFGNFLISLIPTTVK